jgi:glycosyltransferase involved in cell wall biosynthesis
MNIKNYDIVHIHAGRDLISITSLGLARSMGLPYVIQTHGMVTFDSRNLTRVMDALFVRRLLRQAVKRFVLTQEEANELAAVLGPGYPTLRLVNGVPAAVVGRAEPAQEQEVLFCARLQKRKRPTAFVEVAKEVLSRGVRATFALVGPDEGELGPVLDRIRRHDLSDVVRYDGALDYSEVVDRMSRASVYLLPSINEPFAMSLLEALSLGIPSICTNSCGIANILKEYHAAIVTGESVTSMADALERLLSDPALRSELSINARRVVEEVFSMAAVGKQLEQAYADVLVSSGSRHKPKKSSKRPELSESV